MSVYDVISAAATEEFSDVGDAMVVVAAVLMWVLVYKVGARIVLRFLAS